MSQQTEKRGGIREANPGGRPSKWKTPGGTIHVRIPKALVRQIMDLAEQLDANKPIEYDNDTNRAIVSAALGLLNQQLNELDADRHAKAKRTTLRAIKRELEQFDGGMHE